MADDPIRELLAAIPPAPFLWTPQGTVAIMQDKVIEAGGDPDEILRWVEQHGGHPDKTVPVSPRRGPSLIPKIPGKPYYVVPEDALG